MRLRSMEIGRMGAIFFLKSTLIIHNSHYNIAAHRDKELPAYFGFTGHIEHWKNDYRLNKGIH